MTPVLIVVIAVVAVGLTIRSAQRALAERDAVERHHRTLDVLGTLSERAEHHDHIAPRASPPAPARRELGYRPAMVIGIIGIAGAMVAGGLYLRSRPPRASAPAPASTAATGSTLGRAPASGPTAATGTPAVILLASDTHEAHYRVQRQSVDLELVSTAACWVEIRDALGTGVVLFVGVLKPGTHRSLPTATSTGGLRVRLGNPPGVAVSMDGSILATPHPSTPQPFTLFFQPPS